jgi:hypothetical protein
MTTPTSPMDPPKADLNHDLDNNQKQKPNQADMPGKPMQLRDADDKPAAGKGAPNKTQHAKEANRKPAVSERGTGETRDPKDVPHKQKPNHSGNEGKSRT